MTAKLSDIKHTPYSLHQAIQDGEEKIVKSLLAAKADPNSLDLRGRTTLMVAIEHHAPFVHLFYRCQSQLERDFQGALSCIKLLNTKIPKEWLRFHSILDAYLITFPSLVKSASLQRDTRVQNVLQAGKWVNIPITDLDYLGLMIRLYKLDVDLSEKQVFNLVPVLCVFYWVTHHARNYQLPPMMREKILSKCGSKVVYSPELLIYLKEKIFHLPPEDFKRIQDTARTSTTFKPYGRIRAHEANAEWFKIWLELETLAEPLLHSKFYKEAFRAYLS